MLKSSVLRFIIKSLLAVHNGIYFYIGILAIRGENGIHPKHRLTDYHKFFIDNVNCQDSILDIGCGDGLLLKDMLKKTGSLAVGIDISEDKSKAAKYNLSDIDKVEIVNSDIWRYHDSRKFDVVVLSNILEHLNKRSELLQYIMQSFGPKKILIRVPVFDRDWLVPYKKEFGLEWRLDNTHKVEYTEELFRNEIETAGLKIKELFFRWGEIYAFIIPF